MRGTVPTALALLASFCLGQDASAQAATSSPSDPIIVTARPLPPKRETLRWFRVISGYPDSKDPLSRMTQPLCIGGVGLPRDTVLGIADRIMVNAVRLGITLGGDKCRPNVLVLFVDDGADQVMQFGNGLPTLKIPSASRINLPIKSQIAAAVLLIDRNAVLGKSIDQIGDYATMRLLAEVRPQKSGTVSSILSLFDPDGAAPDALTPFDWGYLRGLYVGQGNRPPAFQFADMTRFIDEEIKNGAAKT